MFIKPQNNIPLFKFLPFLLVIIVAFLPHNSYAQDEDRDPVVWKISFEGNESYRGMVLKELIATDRPNPINKLFGRVSDFRINETELRRDRIRLMRYYERRGFIDIEIEVEVTEGRKEWHRNVTFHITEGEPVRIHSSEIIVDADEETRREVQESRNFQRAAERHEFREGQRYQSLRVADVEGRFIQILENEGYAWPQVTVNTEIDSLTNRANVVITARPNYKTYFENITIEGDLSVPERILLRETDIAEGEVYSRNKMQEAQRQIFNHHLFRFATVTLPEQPRDSTLNVLIRVREHPLRSVRASVGFGREELLRGQLGWQHRNINGNGHRLGFNSRASFIEQRLSADYLIPYVFNPKSSNVTTVFGIHKLEPGYELFQAGFNNSLIYQIQRNATASASYEFSINEELSRDPDVSLPDTVLNYNVSSLTFSGYYSEGLSREPRGWVLQPFIELSGMFGESTFTFQKLSLDVRKYIPLSSTTTLAGRINSGTIFHSQDSALPSNILFFAGGTNSVRGWSRQALGPKRATVDTNGEFNRYVPVGGNAIMTFNVELRQNFRGFLRRMGIAAFLDGGQVWSSVNTVGERTIQFGTGGGIRYQSPIGPIRVDVGYKINPTDADLNIFQGVDYGSSWDRIGIHFSIGQAF